jgi:hypothetical protein
MDMSGVLLLLGVLALLVPIHLVAYMCLGMLCMGLFLLILLLNGTN